MGESYPLTFCAALFMSSLTSLVPPILVSEPCLHYALVEPRQLLYLSSICSEMETQAPMPDCLGGENQRMPTVHGGGQSTVVVIVCIAF